MVRTRELLYKKWFFGLLGSGKAVIKGKTIEMQWIRVDQKSSHELLVQVKKKKKKINDQRGNKPWVWDFH